MSISSQQLSDLQADAGLDATQTVFTDVELSRIWDRVAGAATETLQHEAALALIFRQLLADATKFHDYKAGASEEKLSQIHDHLKKQYEMYKPALDSALSRSTEFSMNVLKPQGNQERTMPLNENNSRWFRDDSEL